MDWVATAVGTLALAIATFAAVRSANRSGTFRDPSAPEFAAAKRVADEHPAFTIEILYGDVEGGQRMVTRFALTPRTDTSWIATVSRQRYIDMADPR